MYLLGDLLSWIFGTLSNICWLIVFIPQIKENYINRSIKAMSFYLIFFWFMGDTLSNISAQYKDISSPIVIYVSSYNIIFDIIFFVQYIYYTFYDLFVIEIEQEDETRFLLHDIYKKNVFKSIITLFLQWEIQVMLIYISIISSIDIILNIFNLQKALISTIYGWGSSFIFISSRIPQIYRNYKRKSVKGLSFFTFATIILANYLFLTSILLKLIDIKTYEERSLYVLGNLQWIVGPSITSILDIIILYQFLLFKNNFI